MSSSDNLQSRIPLESTESVSVAISACKNKRLESVLRFYIKHGILLLTPYFLYGYCNVFSTPKSAKNFIERTFARTNEAFNSEIFENEAFKLFLPFVKNIFGLRLGNQRGKSSLFLSQYNQELGIEKLQGITKKTVTSCVLIKSFSNPSIQRDSLDTKFIPPLVDTPKLVSLPLLGNLKELNKYQSMAVQSTFDRHIKVSAPAGTGKTHCIKSRLQHLINSGYSAKDFLVVTFTNDSAKDLRKKLAQFGFVFSGTFHSVCARILSDNLSALNITTFTILSQSDQKQIIRQILDSKTLNKDIYTADRAAKFISSIKSRGIRADKLKVNFSDTWAVFMAGIYHDYELYCKESRLFDFDDLILTVVELFINFPHILKAYQKRFKFVVVDEFQDIERQQLKFLQLLTVGDSKLFAVGDENQSIYSFRGSNLKYIKDFSRYFPNALSFRLNQNYRSPQPMLDVANCVVPKEHALVSMVDSELFQLPKFYVADTDVDESLFVAREIQGFLNKGFDPSDILILYRTHRQADVFKLTLKKYEIPFHIKGKNDVKFYEGAAVKDLLSYLRFIVNHDDSYSLGRILNRPARGLGRKTIKVFQDIATQKNITLWQALHYVYREGGYLGKAAYSSLKAFFTLTEYLDKLFAKTLPLHQKIQQLTQLVGLDKHYESQQGGDSQIHALSEFVLIAESYQKDNGAISLSDFLNYIVLQIQSHRQNVVCLMTLHAVKGLQAKIVFLIGVNDNYLPLSTSENIAEEKRLFYVGLTRAQECFYITRSNSIFSGKSKTHAEPSRFLKLIPDDKLQRIKGNTPELVLEDSVGSLITSSTPDFNSPDWLNTREFAARCGLNRSHARQVLSDSYAKGMEWRTAKLKVLFNHRTGGYHVHRASLPVYLTVPLDDTDSTPRIIIDSQAMVEFKKSQLDVDDDYPLQRLSFNDWLTGCQDYDYELPPLNSGCVVFYHADGTRERTTLKHFRLEGSHSSSVQVRVDGQRFSFSGNFGKLDRYDNVFGYSFEDVIHKINKEILGRHELRNFPKLSIGKKYIERSIKTTESGGTIVIPKIAWTGARFSRIDNTANFSASSALEKEDYMKYLGNYVMPRFKRTVKHDSLGKVQSVYFGKDSTVLTLKFYDKADEFLTHNVDKIVHEKNPYFVQLYQWLMDNHVIRGEMVMRSHFLGDRNLRYMADIMDKSSILDQFYVDYMKPFVQDIKIVDDFDLPSSSLPYYLMWKNGISLTGRFSKTTIYKHAAIIKRHLGSAVDIRNPLPLEDLDKIQTKTINLTRLDPPQGYHLPPVAQIRLVDGH